MRRNTILVGAACLAIGYMIATARPAEGGGHQDRPILRMIARAAKSLLWVALVAEPAPDVVPESQLVHAGDVGDDGFQRVDHTRGW